MSEYLIVFLVVLFIVAAFFREDFVFTLLYIIVGALFLGRWWSHKSLLAISAERDYSNRIFLGEKTGVRLKFVNKGWLPLVWLQLQESLPVELAGPDTFNRVVSLGPKADMQFEYYLEGRKRGCYQIGPLNIYSGDILGIVDKIQRYYEPETITVYPKIIPLTHLEVPSNSPLGTLRSKQPIFEDPSRVFSKRDYVVGDSLRRLDWKATATSGRLQVKQFEPSISLESAIFLNLNTNEYEQRTLYDASELAIVVAASLANWVVDRRQAVGFYTNGADPISEDMLPLPIPPRRGPGHLMRILDLLARVQTADTAPMVGLLNRNSLDLPWGTILILIANQVDDDLFDALFNVRRRGLNVMLVLVGFEIRTQEIRKKASHFGIQLYVIHEERDMDMWRR